jgi:hypothetical protein
MSFKIEYDAQGRLIKPVFEEVSAGEFIPGVGIVDAPPEATAQQQVAAAPEDNTADQPQEVAAAPEEAEEEVPKVVRKPRSPAGEENFRRVREDRDKLQQERDRLNQELESLRRNQYQVPYQQQQQYHQHMAPTADEDVDLNFGDDDLIEGKTLKKIVSNLSNQLKATTQRSQQEIQQAQQSAALVGLKARYPDLDKVVNDETLKDLAAAEPLLAQSVFSAPTLESRYVTAYTMIKNLGLYDEDPYVEQKERVKKNMAKPRVGQISTPASPLATATDYYSGPITPEIAARARKQVEDARRNR